MFERLKTAGLAVLVLCACANVDAGNGKGKGRGEPESGIKLQNVAWDTDSGEVKVFGKLTGVDGPLTVSVLDRASRQSYASVTTGKKFRFRLDDPAVPVPCAVTVTAGDFSANADVRNAPEDCGLFRATLGGIVTDAPIPFATVSVTLGGVTYTTVADGAGAYELEIFSTSLDQLVLVEAEGTSTTGVPIEFVNLTGAFSRAIETPDANVTNVSTASFVLLVAANGGAVPTTEAELRAAETAVDATALLRLSAVIRLIVDDPAYSLPAGQTSLLDFVSDAAAVEQFVADAEAADPGIVDRVTQSIIEDSDLVAGFTPEEIPDVLLAVPVANPGFLARTGEVLEFFDPARGQSLGVAVNSAQPVADAFDWSIVGGRLEVSFAAPTTVAGIGSDITEFTDDPAEIQRFRTAGGADTGSFEVFRTVVGRAYTRVVDGTEVDIVNEEERVVRFVPTIFLADGTTLDLAEPETLATNDASTTLRDPTAQDGPAFSTSCGGDDLCLPGAWAAAFHFQPPADVFTLAPSSDTVYGEFVTFGADGIASGQISGEAASWTLLPDGRLQIDYPDGTRQLSTLVDRLGIEYGVVSIFDDGTQRYASYDIWVEPDTSPALTAADLVSQPGQLWQGDINTWIPGFLDENGDRQLDVTFGWIFDADGGLVNLFNFESDDDGDGVPELNLVRRTGPGYEVAPEEIRLGRFTFANRYWVPVAIEGSPGARTLYVVERELRNRALWFDPSSPSEELSFVRPRVNIYRELDVPTGFDNVFEDGPF